MLRKLLLLLTVICSISTVAVADPHLAHEPLPTPFSHVHLLAAPPTGGIILQFQNAGTPILTRGGGLVIINCTPASTCSASGSTITLNAGGGGGTTINPTNNVLPRRSNATTFVDSALTDNGTNVVSSEQVAVPAGSVSTPGLLFTGGGGFFSPDSTSLAAAVGSVGQFKIANATYFRIGSSTVYAWTSNSDATQNFTDTGLSRDSSGVIDVGNGTALDKSGSLNLTNLTSTGLVDLSAGTMEIPEAAGFVSNANSAIGVDTTPSPEVLHFWNGTDNSIPYIIRLTSQYTNSTTTFSNVAGGNTIQFSVSANASYTAVCHLYYQAASTGGLNIEFTGPASPTTVIYGLNLPVSASAFAGDSVATAFGTSLGSAVTTAATNFDAIVSFSLINGANAGTVNLLAKSSASVQLQIQAGSYCRIQ